MNEVEFHLLVSMSNVSGGSEDSDRGGDGGQDGDSTGWSLRSLAGTVVKGGEDDETVKPMSLWCM